MKLNDGLLRLYAASLRLYPPEFRADFSSEMLEIFARQLEEAGAAGIWSVLRLVIGELGDLPACLIRQYSSIRTIKEPAMTAPAAFTHSPTIPLADPEDSLEPQARRSALLAALPSILFAILVNGPYILKTWGWIPDTQPYNSLITLGYIGFLGGMLIGLFFGWRRKWPVWSSAYYFFGLMVPVVLIIALVNFIDENSVNRWLYPIMFAIIPSAFAIFYYFLAVKSRLRFMISILPLLVLIWTIMVEFIPARYDNLMTGLDMLLAALIIYVTARRGDWRLGMWLIVGATLAIGVATSLVYIYMNNIPPEFHPQPTLGGFFDNLLPLWLAGAAIFLAPLLLTSLHSLARRTGRWGRVGFWLVFIALLVMMEGNILVFTQGAGNTLPIYDPLVQRIYTYTILVSSLVYVIGLVCLIAGIAREQPLPRTWKSYLLVLLPTGIPWTFTFLMVGALSWTIFDRFQSQTWLLYISGFAWVLVCCWLLSTLHFPPYRQQTLRWGSLTTIEPA